jgi:3-oxoadipate enol-lactonase
MAANTVILNYTEQGRGSPLVLLHGFPLSSAIWTQQQQSLGDHYRVITPDLRGHGKSPVPEGVYDMELLARDVLALLDSLEIEQATIMGHSMGGYVTLALWRIARKRFRAFGLISSQAGADSEEARQNRAAQAEKVYVNGSSAIADIMMPRMFSPTLEKDESMIEQTRLMMVNTRPAGIIGSLRGMALRPDSTSLLADIDVPALIMAGDKDQIIPLSKAEDVAASIPNAILVTIENAGHMPMLEQPQATVHAIRNFLSDLEPGEK